MDELNDYGIFLLDIYVLNYYGIKVFFQVCKTTEKSVYLIELATKRYKNGIIMLTKNFSASKKPYIILNNNTRRKSTYEVYPVKNGYGHYLPIEVKLGSRLHEEALNRTDFPIAGTAYAVPVRDVLNKYWVDDIIEEEVNGLA